MSKTALAKAKQKLRSRDIRVTVMRVMIPETGELIGALVPDHPVDRRSMRERKFNIGKKLRATLRQDRNPKFWGKAHVLGGWLADNVEWCQGLDMHAALKRLQERSGIGCDTRQINASPIVDAILTAAETLLGEAARRMLAAVLPELKTIEITEAASLNFDDMDEGEFSLLWDGGNGEGGWIGWLRREVFGGLDAASREEVELIIQKPEQGA
jgi:hypothetical protein